MTTDLENKVMVTGAQDYYWEKVFRSQWKEEEFKKNLPGTESWGDWVRGYGKAKAARVCREKYQKGESFTEIDFQRFAEGASCIQLSINSTQMWGNNYGWDRTMKKIQREQCLVIRGTKDKFFSYQLEWKTS